MKKLPKRKIRRIAIEAAVAALSVFAAVYYFLNATKPPVKSASALVMFTESAEAEAQSMDIPRNVASLREMVTNTKVLESVSSVCGLPVSSLSKMLTVSRLDSSAGAEIIINDLEDRSDAPIILIALLSYIQNEADMDNFMVLNYYRPENEPQLPILNLSAAAAIIIGSLVFFIRYDRQKWRYAYYNSDEMTYKKRTSEEKNTPPSSAPLPQQDNIAAAIASANSLGIVFSAAPDGLEKSGHIHAAEILLSQPADKIRIIAAAAAHAPENINERIAWDAKFVSYLSCALAQLGKRVAVIECNLKRPMIHKLFRKCGKGGISAIAGGSCTIWDAIVPNARSGVDIIAESFPYPAPTAVFSSSAFPRLISYMAAQYDIVLLCAPKAWDSPEWELIYRNCTAVIAVTENGHPPDKSCAAGLLSGKSKYMSICSVYDNNKEKGNDQT